MFGFHRVTASSPEIRIADIDFNERKIIDEIIKANTQSSQFILFPELSLTGYTMADLFHQELVLDRVKESLQNIATATKSLDIVIIVGAPIEVKHKLYNCACAIHKGKIIGIVPKIFHPNYREFYDKRWFTAWNLEDVIEIELNGSNIPFGANLIFKVSEDCSFCIELCEDLWSIIPPSSYHSIAGANLCFNLSASNELVAKSEYRAELIKQQSARCLMGYVYSSSGPNESTTDIVFGGDILIAENGALLNRSNRFSLEGETIQADIDCQKLNSLRKTESSYSDHKLPDSHNYIYIDCFLNKQLTDVKRKFNPHPFVPSMGNERNKRCEEIFNIQTSGLIKRIKHIGLDTVVIGISGGLDSTLALLVTVDVFKRLKKPLTGIIAITMPGFGTTNRTYNNAIELCKKLGVTLREISIKDACIQHFKDIDHDPSIHSVTYENVQARERTQLLMDIANKEGGIVIGTGDLSEIALGWSTYNGDHMSMYAVNCGVPKTLIRYLIQWKADSSDNELKNLLVDVIDTPVSPELLPNDKDSDINQKTEEIVGPYELHDFFLYHFIKYGATPLKIAHIAEIAFESKYDTATIKKWLSKFIWRFFSQQFKRSCIPDGPKVGSISLSPRGDWRMPSDAVAKMWIDQLNKDEV